MWCGLIVIGPPCILSLINMLAARTYFVEQNLKNGSAFSLCVTVLEFQRAAVYSVIIILFYRVFVRSTV